MPRPRFSRGDGVVWRIIWYGRVWWALPVTVIEDGELVVLYIAPRTPFKANVEGEQPRLPPDWRLVDRTWSEKPVLQLTKPAEAHSVWALWRGAGDDLAYWYINLQEPLRRTPVGFDTRDNMLDIVVEPDLSSWRWKDEDHLAEAVENGVFSPTEVDAIRREGERVIGLIEADTPPFDPEWATWRPDPAWPVPTLRRGWNEVGGRLASVSSSPPIRCCSTMLL
jgi:Protein of unknown function (DUF402)